MTVQSVWHEPSACDAFRACEQTVLRCIRSVYGCTVCSFTRRAGAFRAYPGPGERERAWSRLPFPSLSYSCHVWNCMSLLWSTVLEPTQFHRVFLRFFFFHHLFVRLELLSRSGHFLHRSFGPSVLDPRTRWPSPSSEDSLLVHPCAMYLQCVKQSVKLLRTRDLVLYTLFWRRKQVFFQIKFKDSRTSSHFATNPWPSSPRRVTFMKCENVQNWCISTWTLGSVCDFSSSKNRMVSLGFLVFQQDLTLDIFVKICFKAVAALASNISKLENWFPRIGFSIPRHRIRRMTRTRTNFCFEFQLAITENWERGHFSSSILEIRMLSNAVLQLLLNLHGVHDVQHFICENSLVEFMMCVQQERKFQRDCFSTVQTRGYNVETSTSLQVTAAHQWQQSGRIQDVISRRNSHCDCIPSAATRWQTSGWIFGSSWAVVTRSPCTWTRNSQGERVTSVHLACTNQQELTKMTSFRLWHLARYMNCRRPPTWPRWKSRIRQGDCPNIVHMLPVPASLNPREGITVTVETIKSLDSAFDHVHDVRTWTTTTSTRHYTARRGHWPKHTHHNHRQTPWAGLRLPTHWDLVGNTRCTKRSTDDLTIILHHRKEKVYEELGPHQRNKEPKEPGRDQEADAKHEPDEVRRAHHTLVSYVELNVSKVYIVTKEPMGFTVSAANARVRCGWTRVQKSKVQLDDLHIHFEHYFHDKTYGVKLRETRSCACKTKCQPKQANRTLVCGCVDPWHISAAWLVKVCFDFGILCPQDNAELSRRAMWASWSQCVQVVDVLSVALG